MPHYPVSSNNPLPPTIASPSPPIYESSKIQMPEEKPHVGLLGRLTSRTVGKVIFGMACGYLLAIVAGLMFYGFDFLLLYYCIVGAVYGLVIGIMIVMVSTTQLFKTKAYLTCAIIGAIVGVVIRSIADVYSIYGTEFLFILGMRENYPSKSVSGGWFGAIIFGVILGGILGKVYRSDATMLSNNSFNPTPR
jgi:hypothetical protein